MYVSPTEALLQGKTTFGVLPVTVTDEDLSDWPVEVRYELALAVQANQVVGEGYWMPEDGPKMNDLQVAVADVASLRAVLAWRADARKKMVALAAEEAAERKAKQAREHEEYEVERRKAEQSYVDKIQVVNEWAETHGSVTVQNRLAMGMVQPAEGLKLVEDYLFEPFEDEEVYQPILLDEVCECSCQDDAIFSRYTAPSLTEDQCDYLVKARALCGDHGEVSAWAHEGRCETCTCSPVERLSMDVAMVWRLKSGRIVVFERAYALD